eukprot:6103989-Pyramimonas_sp.AAC.1
MGLHPLGVSSSGGSPYSKGGQDTQPRGNSSAGPRRPHNDRTTRADPHQGTMNVSRALSGQH